jgi:hypothetical protein
MGVSGQPPSPTSFNPGKESLAPSAEKAESTAASLDTMEKQSFSCSSQKENDTLHVQSVSVVPMPTILPQLP